MVPFVPDVRRSRLKTRFGRERLKALPRLLCSDEARMPWVGERRPGPIGPDPLANHSVQCNGRDLEAVCHGRMRALAKAGVLGAKSSGMAEGPALETTAPDPGRGQVTRLGRSEAPRGRRHAIAGTGYGGNVCLRIEAATKMPVAVQGGQMQAPEALWTRALVTQARLHRQGSARLPQVVVAQGGWDGTTRWWLDHHASPCVVPATTTRAVTAAARAPAAAASPTPSTPSWCGSGAARTTDREAQRSS